MEVDHVGILDHIMDGCLHRGTGTAERSHGGGHQVFDGGFAFPDVLGEVHGEQGLEGLAFQVYELSGLDVGKGNTTGLDIESFGVFIGCVSSTENYPNAIAHFSNLNNFI